MPEPRPGRRGRLGRLLGLAEGQRVACLVAARGGHAPVVRRRAEDVHRRPGVRVHGLLAQRQAVDEEARGLPSNASQPCESVGRLAIARFSNGRRAHAATRSAIGREEEDEGDAATSVRISELEVEERAERAGGDDDRGVREQDERRPTRSEQRRAAPRGRCTTRPNTKSRGSATLARPITSATATGRERAATARSERAEVERDHRAGRSRAAWPSAAGAEQHPAEHDEHERHRAPRHRPAARRPSVRCPVEPLAHEQQRRCRRPRARTSTPRRARARSAGTRTSGCGPSAPRPPREPPSGM